MSGNQNPPSTGRSLADLKEMLAAQQQQAQIAPGPGAPPPVGDGEPRPEPKRDSLGRS
jgi:hypothetical protein